MNKERQMDEHINTTAATVASYTTSGGLFIFGMTASDAASVVIIASGLVGILLGFGTFAVNWYYRHKDSSK